MLIGAARFERRWRALASHVEDLKAEILTFGAASLVPPALTHQLAKARRRLRALERTS
ncbi:MAG TPA: hypothetical protein VGF95_14640 [Solirubrobacteraceae bacterium]|jgi:hypothetical protein